MSIAFRSGDTASALSTTIALGAPAGVSAGDQLIVAIYATLEDSWATIPAGWVNHGFVQTGASYYLWLFTKTATASEPVSYSWVYGRSTVLSGLALCYSGDPGIDGLNGGVALAVNSYNPPPESTTNTGDIVVGIWSTTTTITAPAGTTLREANTGATLLAADSTVGAPGSYQPGAATGGSGDWAGYTIALRAPVPLAPTLVTPANGATLDLAAGGTFQETYNTGGATGGETAYHFRRKATGGAYQYWNAGGGGSWQGTDVANTSVNPTGSTLVFGSGHWTDGTVYQWSMRSEDANGAGAWAADRTITAQAPPSLSVTAPTGTLSATAPAITWTATPAAGAVITNYRVIVYSAAEYGAGGFTPGVGPSIYDSGLQTGNPGTLSPDLSGANGLTLRAYVQVTQTGAQPSSWQFTGFTLAANPPATPQIAATLVQDANGRPFFYLLCQGHDNVLSAQRASFDDGSTPWPDTANASLGVVAFSPSGGQPNVAFAMSMQGIANGDVVAYDSGGGTSAWPVVPGHTYTALAWVGKFSGTARTMRINVNWFKASGAASSHPTDFFTQLATSTLVQMSAQVVAPADAAYGQLEITVQSATTSDVHLVTAFMLAPGTLTAWTAGGFLQGPLAAVFERADDGLGLFYSDVRNGGRAMNLVGETSAMDDYEAIPNETTWYRCQVVAGNLASDWSAPVAVTLTNTSWDVMDPVAGGPALGLHRVQSPGTGGLSVGTVSLGVDRTEVQGDFQCFGRSTYVVTRGTLMDEEFDLGLLFYGDADAGWRAFDALRSERKTLLLRGDMPGQRYYVAFGATRPMQLLRAADRVPQPTRAVVVHCFPVPVP